MSIDLSKVNLSVKKTKEKFVAIADCPSCKEYNVILAVRTEHFIKEETGQKLDITFIYCPNCQWTANFDEESMSHIKGYISLVDLETLGFHKLKCSWCNCESIEIYDEKLGIFKCARCGNFIPRS